MSSRTPPPPLPDARVVVLVRQGCHLCDDALTIIEPVCRDAHASWQTVDVDSDPDLRARYTDHVPVTFVDGVQHALWFVDAERLAAALA
ncbi:MAG: glutaredoxin family protein [Propioniciclava sp.]|uniref:glutaredoxin family protein n=1 Tax=Propioniciclava sp. TaxID=2038686 RepID=UPI0039E2DF04